MVVERLPRLSIASHLAGWVSCAGYMANRYITAKGVRQNNLQNIDVKIPLNRITVVTGVSGSGKSSLAFDTIYAEGQRRYVETFSAYTRQFLDRMDKPVVDSIEGIPPAVAIDQTNPVRTSRSTVGTMTELSDHIKLLFPRIASLSCGKCDRIVRRDTPANVYADVAARFGKANLKGIMIAFSVSIPKGMEPAEARDLLAQRGYHRMLGETGEAIEVIQDRVPLDSDHKTRIIDDIEAAYYTGDGSLVIYPVYSDGEEDSPTYKGTDKKRRRSSRSAESVKRDEALRFSEHLHCPDCDIVYHDPVPNTFSFNSPIGACERCKGFGRTIDFDLGLVIPDESKSLRAGAIKPWQTKAYNDCQRDLMSFAAKQDIPVDLPWSELTEEQRRWVVDGEGEWDDGYWYGVRRFFSFLEGRSYRMHIRVLLSRYRSYNLCSECNGSRLKSESLLWRIEGKNAHDIAALPIDEAHAFFSRLPARGFDEATTMILDEIVVRLKYLCDVGLGYLTLDRQSRTLSGGEVQRINLTTALGTSLTNTLFVLDEPSIGLHSRDIGRLIEVIARLKQSGNTLLIVEHDPEVIRAADHVIDIGPGPGAAGGKIVFSGTVTGMLKSKRSLTGRYLSGGISLRGGAKSRMYAAKDRPISIPSKSLDPIRDKAPCIAIRNARAHNLKGIDVEIPTGRFVCVTGVSGSGKSTLIEHVLFRSARKFFHRPTEVPGICDRIEGFESFDDVVLVDQAPIGKTARSNPASYVGSFGAIRTLFANEPEAKRRGYTPGTFSFNSGNGRCETCGGTGFEHVEMQFLSDVYIRCQDCNGTRYRSEILEVRLYRPGRDRPGSGRPGRIENDQGAAEITPSISDVLEMTVEEAADYFGFSTAVVRGLKPLQDVGLGYLRLGQPVPTLSGGETQRLKLAGHLAEFEKKKTDGATLFLFDEPTRGLHLSDIEVLTSVLKRLVDHGHSVVVIEHNLDLISVSDWIIDIGPNGGNQGGELVYTGPTARIVGEGTGFTADALRAYRREDVGEVSPAYVPDGSNGANGMIHIRNAKEHNLKGIEVKIPRDKLNVITGVSGSGKSTVAFDILFAEGQRRYLESLNAYARQFVQPASRPDVDSVRGVPPTVAIEQRTSRGGWKSTVGTVTEVYDFLRLLFVKLGVQYCPDCNVSIETQSVDRIMTRIYSEYEGTEVSVLAPLVVARKGYYTELADWANRRGITQLRVDGEFVSTDDWPRLDRYREHSIEAPLGVEVVSPDNTARIRLALITAVGIGSGAVVLLDSAGKTELISTRNACPKCERSFPELDPRLFSYNSHLGWCPECTGTGRLTDEDDVDDKNGFSTGDELCPACHGTRLRDEARAVRFKRIGIAEMAGLPVAGLNDALNDVRLDSREEIIARDILAEIRSRIAFLNHVGLGYLSLNRGAPGLSGGEAQRIRLAAQLGSNLRGVCYVLDEPTIGLHPRDTERLLDTLVGLKNQGNTVVVVEHDVDTILRADHVIDLGPGAGNTGGEIVAYGTPAAIRRSKRSVTGKFLDARSSRYIIEREREDGAGELFVRGAHLHNLQNLDVPVPLQRFVCVTGVSGSGKSTLVRDIMYTSLHGSPWTRRRKFRPIGCEEISGYKKLDRVSEVDQTPIGKTPRSCVATYVGIWDHIRKLFAEVAESKMRAFTPSRFSFNTVEGRCPACKGQGYERVEMSFLPEVRVLCDVCNGRRFDPETLAVRFKGKSVFDVLEMEVDVAVEFFSFHPKIHAILSTLRDVGLGYLSLGQQSPTLSGGEAQRIKLVTELAKTAGPNFMRTPNRTLYLLDEPTIGLHMADVAKLIDVLHRFVDAGHTLIVVEHNLDVIAAADWIIDLGPEGGDEGGRIVAAGTPRHIASKRSISHTGRYLADYLNESA